MRSRRPAGRCSLAACAICTNRSGLCQLEGPRAREAWLQVLAAGQAWSGLRPACRGERGKKTFSSAPVDNGCQEIHVLFSLTAVEVVPLRSSHLGIWIYLSVSIFDDQHLVEGPIPILVKDEFCQITRNENWHTRKPPIDYCNALKKES